MAVLHRFCCIFFYKATLEEVYSIYPAFFKYLINWKRRKSTEHLKDEPHETPDLQNPDNPYVNLPEIGNPDYVSLAKSHERNNLKVRSEFFY